jgi:transcriptional regulator with XRE-family HTH domain
MAFPLDVQAPFAAKLRGAIARSGADLQRLAEQAGISRTTLYHLLEGHTSRPRASTLKALAEALQLSPDEFLDESSLFDATRKPLTPRNVDRVSNPEVTAVATERPTLFRDWSEEDWDELYSSFGTGGPLNRQGVVLSAERINRKRETIRRLHLVLETHLRVVAEELIDTLYRMVRPQSNLADSESLRNLLAEARGRHDDISTPSAPRNDPGDDRS